jgi:isopentenyl-diphosphate delta-isomerase
MSGVESRKEDHIEIALRERVESRKETSWFEYVYLVHRALPEIDLDEVDMGVSLFGKKLSAPLIIDSMTGGSEKGAEINRSLARIASKLGIGMGVGSQRAAIENPELSKTFSVVREEAPETFVYANIGAPQLARGFGVEEAKRCVEMVKADALVIHLNPLQEAVQAEGEPHFRGVLDRIKDIVDGIGVPVIVKEVGAGLSREVVALLESVGVSGFNVAGVGGTSWAGVESIRSRMKGATEKALLGETFWDWGIPTAAAILEARSVTKKPVIASGGIRSGLDVAKAIALGADAAAMALPVLRTLLLEGEEGAYAMLKRVVEEVRLAMFLTGSRNLNELRSARYVLVGKLAEWARALGVY